MALYLHNGPEYLEAMAGSFAARAVPINVNYRYQGDELRYLFGDAAPRAVVFHDRFASMVAEVRDALPEDVALVQVADETDAALLPGAERYEDWANTSDGSPDSMGSDRSPDSMGNDRSPDSMEDSTSPDDRYILYTGGTTGMPKGVIWRQGDFAESALGVTATGDHPHQALAERAAARDSGPRVLPAAPFMHGAAHWNALSALLAGGTVVIADDPSRLDPAGLWAACEREQVSSLLIVGDAFARPLVEALDERTYDLAALRHLITGGAILSEDTKTELLDLVPGLEIVDILGSSESGRQAISRAKRGDDVTAGRFRPNADAVVLDEGCDRLLEPGSDELGWLGQRGPMPTGYLGDESKTRATFPVVDGVRYAVPGDRARIDTDGSIELHGRESVTINTGGEKVFAEEVEHAVKSHPAVLDAVVVGRPSERWGQAVAAVIQLREGAGVEDDDLADHVRAHLADYKVPRTIVRRDRIERSPAGKADYRWAKAQVT